jgi:hypothetical protein
MNLRSPANVKVLKSGWLFIRYVCGLFLAWVSSLAVFVFLVMSIPDPSRVSGVLIGVMAGFVGVGVGPFTVPFRSRVFASFFYLLLGLLEYVRIQYLIRVNRDELYSPMFPMFYPLAAGGFLGVCLHLALQKRYRPHPMKGSGLGN